MNKKTNEKGVVLIIALLFIVVLSAISSAILVYMYNQGSSSYKEVRRLKALYACEAALNYAYVSLAIGRIPPDPTYTETILINSTPPIEVDITIGSVTGPREYCISCKASY